MGYEYELLERLCKHLGVKLKIKVEHNMDSIFEMLNRGEGDLIAYGMTVTKKRKKKVNFTKYLNLVEQVLVQRKPANWRQLKQHEIDKAMVRNVIDLIGEEVYVRENSSYYARLQNLSDEIGGDISIKTVDGSQDTEQLIRMVADGQLPRTVADANIALINAAYLPNIDIETRVSFPQRIAWSVRKNSPQLLYAINQWISDMRKQTDYYVIYNKYYKNSRSFKERQKSEFFLHSGQKKLSPFDELIKKQALQLNWDWRLLASQVYQESKFDPDAKSWAGAKGLMQLMPETGKQYGAKNLFQPRENLKAGTAYLKWLTQYWQHIPDSTQRIKFVLASYNTGQGHIQDARALAEKYGSDPNHWDEQVESWLLKKSISDYFTDPVVQFGYCRGHEPVDYVKEILDRYELYLDMIE